MNIYKIATLFVLLLVLLMAAVGLFIFLVPMDFYVTAPGRVEPWDFRRLDVSESGKLVFTIRQKEFKKGDLLYELESTLEQKELAALKEEEGLLKRELALLKTKIEFEKKQYQWQLEQARFSLDKIDMELELQKRQMAINKMISEALKKQSKLDEELKDEESKIFTHLYAKKLLPKLDLLKIIYEKSSSKAAVQQAENRTIQMLFENEVQAKRLEADRERVTAEKKYLESIPGSLTSLFDVENRLMELKARKVELEIIIKRRKYLAPFDGVVMLRAAKRNSFVAQDQVIMTIADVSDIVFVAQLNPDTRSEIKEGMEAEIYMDNYYFHKYGILDGKVLDIQTDLPSHSSASTLPAPAAYYVTLSVNKPFRQFETGLTGKADLITFRGTIFQYLWRNQLGR